MISPNNYVHFDNMIANIPKSLGDCHVGQCEGVLKGWPAIIVASGPSLNYALRVCKKSLDRAYTFCADSALRVFQQETGREPDFVLSCDGSASSESYIMSMSLDNTLISCITGYPRMFVPDMPRIVVGQDPTPFSGLYGLTGRKQLRYWGSVSSMALAVADFMGCDPIIFVGQDFSFSDTLYSHALGSPAGYRVDPKDENLRKEFNNQRKVVYTTVALRAFRDFMNQQVDGILGKTIIDVSEGIFSGVYDRWIPDRLNNWLQERFKRPTFKPPKSNWNEYHHQELIKSVQVFKYDTQQFGNCLKGIAQSDSDMLTKTDGTTLFKVSDAHRERLRVGLDTLEESLTKRDDEKEYRISDYWKPVIPERKFIHPKE